MALTSSTAAFENGTLRLLSDDPAIREVALGLPLSRLLVRLVRVPEEHRADPAASALPLLQAISPFPDATLTVSCETVRDDARGLLVLAAALPEDATDDVAEALDAKKLNVTRIDALALGQLRGLWNALGGDGRRLVMMGGPDCISAIVLDGETPCAIRAISNGSDLKREVMWSLLEAEDFGGPMPLAEIVVTGDVPTEGLETFAPVRKIECGEDVALVGVAERTADPAALNALPQSWREVLDETRFKGKLTRALVAAGAVWLLALGILFGVPMAYGFMTDHQKDLSKAHARKYAEVRDMKERVELVKKYSDHSRGALEIMKAVSDRLPAGVTLNSWSYRRDEGVRIAGDSDMSDEVTQLKNKMVEMGTEMTDEDGNVTDDGERVFQEVTLPGGIKQARNGKFAFAVDMLYKGEEEE